MKEVEGLQRYGPDVAECVRFELGGLRITLPAGYPRQRSGTGVVTEFGVRGDFEITVGLEILEDSSSGGSGNPTELRLVAVPNERPEPEVWYKPTQNRAYLARVLGGPNKLGHYLTDVTKWNPVLPKDKWGNEQFQALERHDQQSAPTQAKIGRLRLVRHGPTLYFLTSEGSAPEFTLLHKGEFGTKDLRDVRVLGSTGYAPASLDVRITDLRIRADSFVRASEPAPLPAAPAPPWRWRLVLLTLGVPILAVAFVLAWWWSRRRAASEGSA